MLATVSRSALFAGILVLGGCASVDWAYYTVTEPLREAFSRPHHATTANATNVVNPPPPPYWNPGKTPDAKPVAAATPTATPTPVVVNGLSGNAVRTLLGQPATRAGPAPGETWTYRSGSCEVNLFLFPDVTHGGLQVLDHRVTGANSHGDEEQACLRRVRDGQNS